MRGYHMCSWVVAQHVWLPAGWWLWFLLLWERTMSGHFYIYSGKMSTASWSILKNYFCFSLHPFSLPFPSLPFSTPPPPSFSFFCLFFCLIYRLLIYLGFNTFYVWITNFMSLPRNVFSFCWLLLLFLIWWFNFAFEAGAFVCHTWKIPRSMS